MFGRWFWKGCKFRPHKEVYARILITFIYKLLPSHPKCESPNILACCWEMDLASNFMLCIQQAHSLAYSYAFCLPLPHCLKYLLPGMFPLWYIAVHNMCFLAYPIPMFLCFLTRTTAIQDISSSIVS